MARFVAVCRWATLVVAAVVFCSALFALGASRNLLAEEGAASPTASSDPFPLPPTDDPVELVQFIEAVRAARPPVARGPISHRARGRYFRAANPAIDKAAKKVLSIADKKSESYAAASAYLLDIKYRAFDEAEAEDRVAILDEVIAHLRQHGVRETEANVAFGISQALEQNGDLKAAARAYQQFGALMKTSEVEEVRGIENEFSAPGRRLGLVGSEMEVFGKTLDGKDFDWSKYKGKVVLVSFWATWCPSCVEELPNIKEAYEKYHKEGFDVVGISVDQRRLALDEFLEERDLPWVQLHEEAETNKLAEHYDVPGPPFVALVGRDGKVISTSAHGRELQHELEKIFGAGSAPDVQTNEAEAGE